MTLYPPVLSLFRAVFCTLALCSPLQSFAQATDKSALVEQKAAREARVAELELIQGAYSPELGAAYFDLGSTLSAMGDHAAAATMFGKSLQALRSGKGLYELGQLPILQSLLNANESLEHWQDVDAMHTLIYYTASHGLAPGNDTRYEAALKLGRWKLHAAEKKLLPDNQQPTADAIAMYKTEIHKMEAAEGSASKNLQLSTLYLDLAGAELMEGKRIFETPLRDHDSSGQSATVPQQQCETIRFADGRVQRICTMVQVPNMDFYIAKTNNKNQLISTHMNVMRDAVKQSLTVLKNEKNESAQRTELLKETDKLIRNYNDFMHMVNSTVNPKLGRSDTGK